MNEVIKKRTIKVKGMSCQGCERNINKGVLNINGVKNVQAQKEGSVYLEYDLLKVNLGQILQKIRELGYKPVQSLFHSIKYGLINFTEKNEYDNMTSYNRSCCSVDEGGHIKEDL